MSTGPDDEPKDAESFIPHGAESTAWLAYVDRVRERRVRALAAATEAAVAAGDVPAARAALAEAQQLQPDAPALPGLASRVATLGEPVAARRPSRTGGFGRAAAVLAVLIVLMTLVIFVLARSWGSDTAAILVVSPPATPGSVGTMARTEPLPATASAPTPASPDLPQGVEPGSALPSSAGVPPPDEREAATTASVDEPPPRVADDTPAAATAPPDVALPPAPTAGPTPAPVIPDADTADRLAIRRVLDRYSAAYSRLDADAVAGNWRGLDTAELARAFASLQSQDLRFKRCVIDVIASRATARCAGELQYIPRVGVPVARIRAVTWDFTMAKESRGWIIEGVTAR